MTAMLQAMEQYCAEYMRSPQFLEAMKKGLDASIGARQQLNDFWVRAHHELQGVARQDIDFVMQNVRHLETRMLDRMDELASRLDRISEQRRGLKNPGQVGGQPDGRGWRIQR